MTLAVVEVSEAKLDLLTDFLCFFAKHSLRNPDTTLLNERGKID